MAASAVKMTKVARLLIAGAKAVSPEWEDDRGRSRCSHHSPVEVRLKFFVSSVFS
jgi:hypothetical protein